MCVLKVANSRDRKDGRDNSLGDWLFEESRQALQQEDHGMRYPGPLNREREMSVMVSALARVVSGEASPRSGTESSFSGSGGFAHELGYSLHGGTSSYSSSSSTSGILSGLYLVGSIISHELPYLPTSILINYVVFDVCVCITCMSDLGVVKCHVC